VSDRAPGARQPFIGVFQRFGELVPGRGRAFTRKPSDQGAVLGEQLVDCGGDLFRPDRAVARQTGEIEQRIDVHFHRPPRALSRAAAERSADMTVFSSNIAIVMGPTPPGTGVMHEAIPSTPWKSMSPASFPSGSRLMPISMTAAPGLTIPAVTSLGLPAAATRISA